ncbi:PAAR domain-containing protein [Pseudomonas paraveronii]|uniref:PAAR domain-containing protein n=1 Tax=Pseudomonas paraveronii TaxID=3040598 RepID=UPI002AAF1D8D|nr:PAAR domain-containing protein [Pseudomonas sp. V3/K/3/5]
MPGKPAARVSDPTTCPVPGHGTNPIASGSPDVFFDGLAAARVGDTCTCGQALSGGFSSTVFINGRNAMTFDGTTDHGGVVIGGSGTVIIGNSHTPAPFIPPLPIIGLPLVDFTVISAVDGEPIVQQTYELETAEGRIVKGQTNAQGMTQSVATRQPDLAVVRWTV